MDIVEGKIAEDRCSFDLFPESEWTPRDRRIEEARKLGEKAYREQLKKEYPAEGSAERVAKGLRESPARQQSDPQNPAT